MTSHRLAIARIAAATALAVAAVGLGASPAHAAQDYWGAIAISVRTGNAGYAWDHPTAGAAASAATRKCGASDCRTVVRVANGYAAVAQARNRAWGWGWAATRAAAERAAAGATPGPGARTVGWLCTTAHR
jgi:Domain of unknown function (DUF4189)